MLNISQAECGAMQSKILGDNAMLSVELDFTNDQLRKLQQRKMELENKISKNLRKQDAIRKASLLIKPLPQKLVRVRTRLLSLRTKEVSPKIRVNTLRNLKAEYDRLRIKLSKLCDHPFVLDEPGYEGDQHHDFENRRPGERCCVICGFREETYETRDTDPLGWKEYIYIHLKPSPDRVIEKQPFRMPPKKPDIWVPLGAVLHHFEKLVADDLNT